MAADYTDMATDLSEARADTPDSHDAAVTAEGAEAARLIDIAHPEPRSIGPAQPAPFPINAPGAKLDLEHVSQL
ncbi:hypothetical protein AWN90_02580 [Nocardia terpenica]|uniref:Uncharacterized protein n=2 Tax=Nocardia terpenica TaxID=455432 RepID=A0A164KQF2_9NOCA|nr:hypothetical protein AWN90_02580 [Nocardia terpenica]